jgi:hypothetical protein
MNANEAKKLIHRYIDGELSEDQVRQFETRVRESEELRQMVYAYQKDTAMVREHMKHEPLDNSFRFKVIANLPDGMYTDRAEDFTSERSSSHASFGTITLCTGDVQIKAYGDRVYRSASIDTPVYHGDIIKTGASGRVAMAMNDSSNLWLNRETLIGIIPEPQKRCLRLRQGEVWAQMKSQDNPFTTETPAGMVSVIGTDYDLKIEPGSNRLTLTVLEGTVGLDNKYGSVEVNANQQAFASPENAPTVQPAEAALESVSWARELMNLGTRLDDRTAAGHSLWSRMPDNLLKKMMNEERRIHEAGNVSLRLSIIGALESKATDEAVDSLIESLQNDDSILVRARAAEALGNIGSRRAIPALEKALHDNDYVTNYTRRALLILTGRTYDEDTSQWTKH